MHGTRAAAYQLVVQILRWQPGCRSNRSTAARFFGPPSGFGSSPLLATLRRMGEGPAGRAGYPAGIAGVRRAGSPVRIAGVRRAGSPARRAGLPGLIRKARWLGFV